LTKVESGLLDLDLRLKVCNAATILKDVGALDETIFDRLINIQTYSDAELKALAQQLAYEEREVSKRRRLLHGEIDIVRAEMVRRLRDKHGAGQGVFRDGDITALTTILAGKGTGDEDGADTEVPVAAGSAAKAEPAQRAIQERFRDLSVSVRDERLLRHISKQLAEGRHLDTIMADDYILTHTNEVKRAQLLQNPQVLRALEGEMRKQFADYDSATRPKSDKSDTD
jgi:hypothetical protein